MAEALQDVRTTRDSLRVVFPDIVLAAMLLPSWPDTMLTHTVEAVAEAIGRLDAAVSLLADEGEPSET